MNRLLILDGNALLHRAYHALPPLTSPDGRPTGAVYGFVSMVLRLKTDLSPTHIAVTFDRPKPTFRNELFAQYQSQRPPMDDELVTQIGTVHEVLQVMHVSIFEVDGFEADDVIGTIVEQVQQLGTQNSSIDQVIIVTGDRDILQLVVDNKVLVYMPTKGLSEAKLYGVDEVVERLGIAPDKIPEWKALCGDPSDNYPGVEGIGPKTATQLVNTYGTIEAVYAAIDSGDLGIKERLKERLVKGKDSAILSKNLATIRKDAPIAIEIEQLSIPSFNTREIEQTLLALGFPSLVKRIQKGNESNGAPKKEVKFTETKEQNQLDLFS